MALFACSAPSAMGYGFLFDGYLQLLLFVSLIFGSLLISTTNLAGPLRYAYNHYDDLVGKAFPFASHIGTKVMGWAPLPFLVLVLLPWFRTGFFMGILPATWQFVREEHLQKVSELGHRLDELCSKAKMDAEKALSDAGVARQHERDLKQNLKDSHYDESSLAWKAKPEFEKLQVARREDRMTAGHKAGGSGGAAGPTERPVQYREAGTVAAAVHAVTDDVLDAVNAAQKAVELLGHMQCQTVEAKTLAKQGLMDESAELEEQVKEKSTLVEREREQAEAAKGNATRYARGVYLTWQLVCEEHRRVISELENNVDGRCAQAQVAANKAQSDLGDAERYRNDMEQKLRAADFYNTCLIGRIPPLPAGAKQVATLAAKVDKCLEEASTAAESSVEASVTSQTRAAEAKTAAREGRRDAAVALEKGVTGALETAEKQSKQAAKSKEEVRTLARDAYRECQSVCEEHRRNVSKLSNEVDECCSNAQAAVDKALSDADTAKQHKHRLEQNLRADNLYSECSAAYLARAELPRLGSHTDPPSKRTVQGATLDRGVAATTAAAATVAENAVEASDAAQESLQLLREIQHAAVQIKTAAGEGRMGGLDDQVTAARVKLDAAIKAAGRVETAEKNAGKNARDAHIRWLLAREHHAEEVAQVTTTVDKACIHAVALSGLARAELGAAERLENTAHALVANVVRDARTAHDVGFSDFFEQSEVARGRLEDYPGIVKQVTDSASDLGVVVNDLGSRAGRADISARTKEALEKVQDPQQQSERIRRGVEHFELATENARTGREMLTKAAEGAVTKLGEIKADVVAAAEAAREAAKHADDVRQFAVEAKAAAALGGDKGAEAALEKLKKSLQACETQFKQAVDKRKDVQEKMVQFARKTYLPNQVDQDEEEKEDSDEDMGFGLFD